MATAKRLLALVTLFLVSLADAQNTTETTINPCDPSPCQEGTSCHPAPTMSKGSNPYLCLGVGYRPGSCSSNAYLECDKYAACIDSSDELSFTCQCQEGAAGDGFQEQVNGTGCQLAFQPCSSDTECPEFGYCDLQGYRCVCKLGFQGNGFNCTDIDECLNSPCHEKATCQNSPGNYTCTCNINFVGDGHTCVFFCLNDNVCDVPRAKCDVANKCQCIQGYQGDGQVCEDVDECAQGGSHNCSADADCVNEVGSYLCHCKNGFYGDGYSCSKRPQRCDDISNFEPGSTLVIDPDFTGPANSFEVICDLTSGIVVTKLPPTDTFPLAAPADDKPLTIHYKASPSDITPLTEGAVFCYQDISFSCYSHFALFPGTVWMDAQGRTHQNWGSTKHQKCACGEVGVCPASCYCDGSQTATLTTDSGQIVDKGSLPLVELAFSQGQRDKGRVNIGPLVCAQAPINVPKDCHEAKFKYNIKTNTPMYIDVDGDGGLAPALVYCDMQAYRHVGITSVPPDSSLVVITSETGVEVSYNTGLLVVQALIKSSLFCSQFVEFTCKNSRLSAGGGYVSVTDSYQRLGYFPGADGEHDSCGCGATRSCEDPQVRCNCDIEDGRERKDFGLITNREHLPVVSLGALVGNNRTSRFRLGNVQCSQKQFGIEPNCEKYRATGTRENYTYPVDPDGPGGLPPFLVECRFLQSPPQGQTIVHHTNESQQVLTETTWNIVYLQASTNQIAALKNRSTVCTQEVKVNCQGLNINGPGDTIIWTSGNGRYSLPSYLNTCGTNGRDCNCKQAAGSSTDSGTLADADKLPVSSLDLVAVMSQLTSGGQLRVTLGPLVCSEVFATCAVLKKFLTSGAAVEGEATAVNGKFTIDPDGAGGVDGFEVTCTFPTTIIRIESPIGGLTPDFKSPGPVSTCFDIVYKNENGDRISAAQVTALVEKSSKCQQDLLLECQNAPASQFVNYTSCNGQPQKGWAGSFGVDKCACGVNGNCAGGPQASCNCDMADGVVRSDGGSLINKESMPVCQICFSINTITPPAGGSGPTSMLRYKLGELKCDTDQGTKTNCQDARQKKGTDIKTVQEMAVPVSSDTDLPVGCRFFPDPPVGVLIVKASNPVNPPSVGNHTDVKIVYITISIHQVRQTFTSNEFCSQNIFLFNASAQNLQLTGNWGFYTFDGQIATEWTAINETSKHVQKACTEHADLCSRFGPPKGFSLTNKDDLPVTRVVLSGAGVVVVVGDVECLDLKKSCQHVLDSNSLTTGFIGGKRYAIDPDGADEIDPFVVNCEFDQPNGNGVTEVVPSGQWTGEVVVTGKQLPASYSLSVEYSGATARQISALTHVSGFCWQWVLFNCRYTPLVNRTSPAQSFYDLYGRQGSSSFGTGFDVDSAGCACAQTGTCVSSYSCNCDALLPLAVDQGAVTNKGLLPITKMFVGGQQNARSSAKVRVTGVRCSSLPIDPPRDCADAQKTESRFGVFYSYNGEYLISPSPGDVDPFMVRCEFDFSPGVGVTVIKVVSEKVPLPRSRTGTVTNITYHSPSEDQLLALIKQSKFCYQAVKYECRSTTLFSEGGYWLSVGSEEKRTFWGGGQPWDDGLGGTCACGEEENCGGLDSANGQRTRPCNCDFGDNTTRLDAGILSNKDYLPVSRFVLGPYAKFTEASLTVGDLYCSQEPLKFNECELGFFDCHPIATCVDEDEGYRCVCPEGWNGRGVVINSTQARANGRECIDDDECVASRPCPYSATCVNTPGDFTCECRAGYTKTGKTTCQDINECSNSTLNNCDLNAHCENLDGSFRCVCNRGFRGDGLTCLPVGECVCFGDPHCITYDKRWLHIQSECDFVLSQDGCQPGQSQTFRIEIQTWKRASNHPGKFSYIKSVRIYIFGKEIRLEQKGRIVVDGRVVRQYYDGHRFGVSVVNNRTQLWTVSELLVTWDGQDVLEVTVPRNAKDSVCGLCGNYNGDPADDLVQGPACPETAGAKTENTELFAQSWVTKASSCNANCRPDQPGSPDSECTFPRALVERECDKLFNGNKSPFKDCLKLKEPADLHEFLVSCVYDLCHIEQDLENGVCRFAEILAWDCSDNEKVNVIAWKSKVDACEVPKCPNNLIYQTCSNSSTTQRTCLDLGLEQTVVAPVQCSEGCFCQADLVLEGDRCVTPAQCGCFYESGYLAVGDTVVLPDCSLEIQCVGSNQTVEQPAGCEENQVCRVEDGVLGCYCSEGYLRNNQGKCAPDNCYQVECKIPNMICIDGDCVCQDGYFGDCNQCQDINECLTGIDDCGWIGQTCLNTNGSFLCVCEDGFVRSGQNCVDIDECQYEIDNCGNNSECVNTRGGFLCECCAGYKKSNTGSCVRDASAGPLGAKCCACQGKECADPGQVCGTDGKTYPSFRSLSIAACKANNDKLMINYRGACKGTCETTVCSKQYSTCVMKNGVPTCVCPTCSDTSSSYEDITVCGTDNVTYISKCHLEAATCKAHFEIKVEVQFTGRPCPGDGPPLTGPWSNWSDCSEPCKQGVRNRTREVYANSSDVITHSLETIPCYSTCDQGPCRKDTCTGAGQVCMADGNNVSSCVCPDCTGVPGDLICGRLGLVIQTYPNECELNRTACESIQPDFEQLEPRACEDKPINCGLVRKYDVVVDENGCEADRSINFGECYGGCDDDAELCCFGNEIRLKSAVMYCPNGSRYNKFFEVIAGCSCVSKTEAQEHQMRIMP